jgi:hypothetical protein
MIAITIGLIITIVLGGLHVDLANLLASAVGSSTTFVQPAWLPTVSFTWFAMIGALVVFAIGVVFRTPWHVLEDARRARERADVQGDKPLAVRDDEAPAAAAPQTAFDVLERSARR